MNTCLKALICSRKSFGLILRTFFTVLTAGFLTAGCASVNPFVRDFNIVPIPQEQELGTKMQAQIAQQMKLVQGTSMNKRVDGIGGALVSQLPQKFFAYQFHVVEDKSLNAFAIPGGDIYVHSGLISAASDAELAGVIAHEIGHVYERHPAKAMSRAYGLQYLAGMVAPQNAGKVQQLALQFAAGGILNKYGRDDETEADEVAYYLMKKTSYPPSALITFFQKLQGASGGAGVPAFLSSHPPTPQRIQHLKDLIAQDTGQKRYGL